MAASLGLEGVALTDHDTLTGIPEARDAANDVGIRFIPGVELSVDHDGAKMHMLVYGLEPGRGALQDRLEELRDGRTSRNDKIVSALVDMGFDITIEDVRAHAKGPSVGRPHIADALVAKGYISTRDEAFEHLLHDGGAAYFPRTRLSAVEAIRLGRASGGLCVIAHPKTVNLRAGPFEQALRDLKSAGLGGIEAHHPMHDLDLRHHLDVLAGDFGLIATGGSDYHGKDKREFRIGTGTGDLRVPPSAFDEITAAIRR
ncbi:MAG: PHP domain-containing protein [Acidimicrobiia bacterium]|nr:MAG: PHP domain-containing protein [Acidimicrobiia bacterium]